MYRTLPLQLRHLEKKPLVVPSLVMNHIGYEGLKFHDRAPRQVTPVPSAVGSLEQSADDTGAATTDGDDEDDEELLDAWNTIRKHSQVVRTTTSKPQYREGVKVEVVATPNNAGTAASTVGASPVKASESERGRSRSDSGKQEGRTAEAASAVAAAVPSRKGMSSDNDPRIHDVMMRSIDVNKSGLDINILKYRFERLMLLDICKGNGGRLLMDVFDVTSWNTTPSYSNFTYLVNKNAVTKSPAKGTTPLAASLNGTPVKGNNNNSSSSSSSSGSASKQSAVHNEGVVEIHPIFFGDDE